MIIITGLVILVAAVVAGVAGVLSNSGSGHALTHHFAVFGYHVTGSTGTLFLYARDKPDLLGLVMHDHLRAAIDTQLATLGSYLVQRYGNPQARITAAQVGQLRAGGAASNLVFATWAGMVLAAIAFVAAISLLGRRMRRNTHRSVT